MVDRWSLSCGDADEGLENTLERLIHAEVAVRPVLFHHFDGCIGDWIQTATYGSINFPLAALIAASVRVAAPSLRRELSVWKIDRAFGEPENLRDRNASMMG